MPLEIQLEDPNIDERRLTIWRSEIPSNPRTIQSTVVSLQYLNDSNDSLGSRSRITDEDDDAVKEQNISVSDQPSEINISSYEVEPPYHIFTLAQKKGVVYIVSAAAIFNPLSSNIYFPALDQISKEFKVDIALVSVSITAYMIIQAIAPSFWGPFSDTMGRRAVFIGTFVVYLIANVGLAFSNGFPMLMFFRAVQAAGSAATTSIGAGVIGDITTSRERGGLIGIFGGLRMMGQSLGPVFGGILTQYLGFRSIFWFLLIFGIISLTSIIVFLPETLRSIAGNGSIRLNGFQRPLIYNFTKQPGMLTKQENDIPKRKVTIGSIFSPLKFLFEKDVFVSLFFVGIVYTVWSVVTSTITALFKARFGLTDLEVGLAFLPNGIGCVFGSYLTGYLMDRDYKRTEVEYRTDKGIKDDIQLTPKTLSDFPVERARLRNMWWHVLIFAVCVSVYGFSLMLNRIAVPLVLQFLIAYTATAIFTINSALIIDLYPGASASATAVNNLIRCTMGAIGVAVVQYIIDGIGAGFTFLMFGLITSVFSPLVWVELRYGFRWRNQRLDRLADAAKSKWQTEKKQVEKTRPVIDV